MITVFTPTFNRAETLARVGESLRRQTFRDFEWLVVDDGSTDGTRELISRFKDLPLNYVYQENGGKHRAYNRALREARGEWFLTVDSDDWLPDDGLVKIADVPDTYNIAIALKANDKGYIIGPSLKEAKEPCSLSSLEDQGLKGERTLVFKTEFARQFPFPEIPGEKFMTEDVVYDRMRHVPAKVINSVVTVCEYRSDGLSSNPKRLMANNPGGMKLYYRQRIDIATGIRQRVCYALRYSAFRSLYQGVAVEDYSGEHKLLTRMMGVFSPVVAAHYKSFL